MNINSSDTEFVLRYSRGKGQEVIQTEVSPRDDFLETGVIFYLLKR